MATKKPSKKLMKELEKEYPKGVMLEEVKPKKAAPAKKAKKVK